MTTDLKPLPIADEETGLEVLKGLLKTRSLLTALQVMYNRLRTPFRITMPKFQPAVFVGPEANREILVTKRKQLQWRSESDPVTKLLRRGILVVDGEEHDRYRALIMPSLVKHAVDNHVEAMWKDTGIVTSQWTDGGVFDMLIEMRKVALIILMDALFDVDITHDIDRLWNHIFKLLKFISPGFWILLPDLPRPGFRKSIRIMNEYMYSLIESRRKLIRENGDPSQFSDLLSRLIHSGMDDDLIRDQLMTLFIAGHDTSTAQLAWALFLLGAHPDEMSKVVDEVDSVLGQPPAAPNKSQLNDLKYLEQVAKETLRMYPPIHVGNRKTSRDIGIADYKVNAGSRLMCSIFLSHHDQDIWNDPEKFKPERFDRNEGEKVPPLTYIPFGGGPRNCIGAAFSQVEAKVVLGRLLSEYSFELLNQQKVKPHMGATLEPRPGVMMRVQKR
jgi:cytochrome P450